jgi:NDP-sugar pyrophosphorylase family protein
VRILETQVTWFETGNPADYLAASQSCMQLLNDSRLAKGDDRVFLLELGQRFWQGSPSSLSQLKSLNADASPLPWAGFGSQIAASAVERGSLILAGENVVVEPGALLRGFVILGANTKVSSRGAVENCVLLPGCVVSAQDDVKNEIFLPR